ncbi:MAG: acyl-CoA thioesterase [Marivirga sp.]|nr:acyl-CoA thioesterase [Marivirga sp.]
MIACMKIFEHELEVLPADIDEMGHVNNVIYVRWVQEVAAAHWNHEASALLKEKYAWVVLRHEIDYKNPAFLQDRITGITRVGVYNGARFDRYVKITTGEKILAEAKTTWCLLDAKKLRPTRIPEEIIAILK